MIKTKAIWDRMCREVQDGRRKVSKTKVETWIGFLFSVILFCITLWLQSGEHHLAEFFLAIFTVIPLSILIRVTTEDLLVRFQHEKRELVAGLTSAIFGYFLLLCFPPKYVSPLILP
jgi:hypothetical protein